jgi:hypothetical protein
VECDLSFHNTDVTPRRIPALDGSTLTDSKRPSVPPLSRENEESLVQLELTSWSRTGTCQVSAGGMSIVLTGFIMMPSPGEYVRILAGPNAGRVVQVGQALSSTSVALAVGETPLTPDVTDRAVVMFGSADQDPAGYASLMIDVILDGTAGSPGAGEYIGPVDSELRAADALVRLLGIQVAAGTGTASVSGKTLTDPVVDFSAHANHFVFVPSGLNAGLYKVASSALHSVTPSEEAPYHNFPTDGSTPYVVIRPWAFIPPTLFSAVADFLKSTWTFLRETQQWIASGYSGGSARIARLQARQAEVDRLIKLFESQLGKQGKLYDIRFLWLKQRVDKKDGTLAQRVQAQSKRVENTAKLLADQQKLFIASRMS